MPFWEAYSVIMEKNVYKFFFYDGTNESTKRGLYHVDHTCRLNKHKYSYLICLNHYYSHSGCPTIYTDMNS